jgi:hypothetical protein
MLQRKPYFYGLRMGFRIITLFLICFSLPVLGQKKKTVDEDNFSIRNYKLEPNDRLIIECNHTSWRNLPSGISGTHPSIGFNFALMFDRPIGMSNFSFGYGLGLFSHNFHSNADFIYKTDSSGYRFTTRLSPYEPERNVTLNRYAEKILEIPLEIRYRTKADRQFKIHFGGKIGYVVNNFRSIRDNDGKIRVYDIKNINPIRYGINFRLAFEHFALTATYYFSDIFFRGRGPEGLQAYAVGVAIIPY